LKGYRPAAEYALQKIEGPGIVLFDGHFSGTMVYEFRTQDPNREVWLARADKLFYASLSDPRHGTVEHAKTDEDMSRMLAELCPEVIIVESPRARVDTPQAKRFRSFIDRQQNYVKVKEFDVSNNNLEWVEGVKLIVYVSKVSRTGPREMNIPMLWQGTTIRQVVK
jgi:hypothetical protein